jgi:hypothetical protein
MIIPANVPYGLSVSFPATGLFVGLTIWDVTSGAPVLVTGLPGMVNGVLPMPNIQVSNTYAVNFSGLPNKNYVFQFDVYTDGTYTVINGAYPEQSKSAYSQFLTPVIVNGLKILVGCENQPRQQPVIAAQNSDANILLSFFDEWGVELNITTVALIHMSFLESDELTALVKTATLVAGTINQALVSLLAADLALLPPGENDGAVSFALSGINYVINIYDAIRVNPAIV